MIRRKLIAFLFICILLPVVVMFVQSMSTMISQRKSLTNMSGRYVKDLAEYAADRYNDGNDERLRTFLSLLADPGYNRAISTEGGAGQQQMRRVGMRIMKEKFIPGLVAYVDDTGNLIAHSQNAAILASIFERAPITFQGGLPVRGGRIISEVSVGGKTFTYVSHIVPTSTRGVYAIASISLLSWVGREGFDMMKLASQGFLSMLAALVALFLLHSFLIVPLQELASQVNTLKWGSEMPPEDHAHGFFNFQADEIRSLRKAISDLARRTIEKEDLEKRYLNDIIKAQEYERSRIAQDIHDGPIQVMAALIQRAQIASLTDDASETTRSTLSALEGVAQDAVEELRGICDSLVPPWISLGIVSCMEEAASRFERHYGLTIDLDLDYSLSLDQETTLAIYRIFHEAVSNAVRHGGATEIKVELTKRDSGVHFVIQDNGSGFFVDREMISKLPLLGKRGLSGMKQRVELLGGTYDLHSSSEGTTITIDV